MQIINSNRGRIGRLGLTALSILLIAALLGACGGGEMPAADQTSTAVALSTGVNASAATIAALTGRLTAQVGELAPTQTALSATLARIAGGGTPGLPTTGALPALSGTPGTPGAPAAGTPAAPGAAASGVTVSVSADTNCRGGPGTNYPILSLLNVGKTVAVHGVDASRTFYYVANPSGSGFCWLWNQFATVQGDATRLEIVTAPPPPAGAPAAPAPTTAGQTPAATASTPSAADAEITAAFENIHACGGDVVAVLVTNSGEATFISARVSVRNPETGEVIGQFSSDTAFLANGTACPPGRAALAAGESAYVVAPLQTTLPSGTAGRIVVSACTEKQLDGDCSETRIDFTFP